MLYNKERLIALMDKFDLAGVVAATPENIYYLSGHASWSQNGYRYGGSQVYVVYPRDPSQSPALLIPNCGWLSPESSCFGTNPRYGPTSRLFTNRSGFSKVKT